MSTDEPQIGMWGWYKSGKTAYLVALYRQLGVLSSEWRMYPADLDSELFMEREASAFLPGGVFPLPSSDDISPLSFRVFENGRGRAKRQYKLKVIDVSGYRLLDVRDEHGYFEELQRCSGVLCFIDPEIDLDRGLPRPASTVNNETFLELFERLIAKIAIRRLDDSHDQLPTNLAICVSKSDLDEPWSHRRNIEAYCHSLIGDHAYSLIKNHFSQERRRFFAISTVGRYNIRLASGAPEGPERPNIEPAGGRYKIADLDQWEPENLLQPLKWLFDRIDADKRAAQPKRSMRDIVLGRPASTRTSKTR